MKSKLPLLLLVSVLLLLAACTSDSNQAETETSSETTEELPEGEPAPEVTPEVDEPEVTAPVEAIEPPADNDEPADSDEPESASAAATEAPPATATSEEQAIAKTGDLTIGDVSIPGTDGLDLIGTFQTAGDSSPRPTVLLLHMLNSNRGVWDEFAATLNENGYNTLALDMRGHGDTGSGQEWMLAEQDLILVWQYLAERPDVDETRIAVIGGSIGSNMALITGANVPQINTVVMLSPGLDYRGVKTEPAMALYGDRPVLIVASSEDSYSAESSQTLADQAVNSGSQLHLYDGAGHGTNMFSRADDLTQRLLDWLGSHL